jgi:4-hydroxy-3-methylbut-2-enyl diphosphate reductase
MVFVRTAFFDILDMQGDRIVGKETLPILLGEKQTLDLLNYILSAAVALLIIASAMHLVSGLGFLLALSTVFIFSVIAVHAKGGMLPGMRLEFLVESHFVLAGVITFLWSAAIS